MSGMPGEIICPCGCGRSLEPACVRCKHDYRTVGNPWGAVIVELTPLAPNENGKEVTYTALLCDECARSAIEHMNPTLKDDVGYQAALDQYNAAVRDYREEVGDE